MKYTFKESKKMVYAIATELSYVSACSFKDALIPYLKTFYNLHKEHNHDTDKVLTDLMGPCFTGASIEECKKKGINELIFDAPLEDMVLYYTSDTMWQRIIAFWRINIER